MLGFALLLDADKGQKNSNHGEACNNFSSYKNTCSYNKNKR